MKKATAAIIALLALVLCLFSGCTDKEREEASGGASNIASDIRDGASDAASDIRNDLTDASRDMNENTSMHDGNVGDENSDGRIDDTTDTKAQSTAPSSTATGS